MSYEKLEPKDGALRIKLDTGETITVHITTEVSNNGGLAIKAHAVADDPDANGQPIESFASLHAGHAEDKQAAMRDAVLLVLGEYTGDRCDGPSKEQLLADFSIRTNLASAKHCKADVGALL